MENYNSSRGLILQILKTRMAFRQALQRVLKRNNIDITFEMLQVLSSLWQEQGISQQALAEKTAKDKACMTNLMANLEKKGWIMRQEDPNDRRNRLVYLTPAGEEISDRVRPLIKDFYTQTGQLMGIENLNACSNQLETLYEIFNQFSFSSPLAHSHTCCSSAVANRSGECASIIRRRTFPSGHRKQSST